MPSPIDNYRSQLINRILIASSQLEVRKVVDMAMKDLDRQQSNEEIAFVFTNKILSDLKSFNPLYKDAQQWSNINMARIYINRIRLPEKV